MKEWKNKVINALKKYKSYLIDVKLLELDISAIAEMSMGVSYKNPRVQTNNLVDFTGDKALELVEGEKAKEYKEKMRYIKKMDLIIESLPPSQRFIIKEKFYLRDNGRDSRVRCGQSIKRDIDVYNHPSFELTAKQYRRLKKKAYTYLAQKLNII